MFQTQVNVLYNGMQLKYGVEYVDNIEFNSQDFQYIKIDRDRDQAGDTIIFADDYSGVRNSVRLTNLFQEVERDSSNGLEGVYTKLDSSYNYDTSSKKEFTTDGLPDNIDVSSINVYFPHHSVETYTSNWIYAFLAYIYINGDKVILCEKLLDRRDAIAIPYKKTMHNIDYKEYINVTIPDPWNITYGTEWEDFRHNICKEPLFINNTGSLLTIELHPIKKSDTLSNTWEMLDSFSGGMNTMILNDKYQQGLSTNISYSYPSTINVSIDYDKESYPGDNGLVEYLEETYFLSQVPNPKAVCMLYLFDKNNIHNVYEYDLSNINDLLNGENIFSFDLLNDSHKIFGEFEFNSWEDFSSGLMLKADFYIVSEDESLFSIGSSNFPITIDMFARLISPEKLTINLDSLNMEETNITAVNKIVKNIIQIDAPKDFKSNLTKPVFIRVQELGRIEVHPSVTENISINLRQYKNYVDNFILRIADTEFKEIARKSANVIFKVVGKNLPTEIEDGTYFITTSTGDLVTTGKYTIAK